MPLFSGIDLTSEAMGIRMKSTCNLSEEASDVLISFYFNEEQDEVATL
jgi:hypothetical protein